jgi:hypothetical protein
MRLLCDLFSKNYVTNELRVNSVFSQFDIERKSVFNCMTYYFAISHAICLSETHVFT